MVKVDCILFLDREFHINNQTYSFDYSTVKNNKIDPVLQLWAFLWRQADKVIMTMVTLPVTHVGHQGPPLQTTVNQHQYLTPKPPTVHLKGRPSRTIPCSPPEIHERIL